MNDVAAGAAAAPDDRLFLEMESCFCDPSCFLHFFLCICPSSFLFGNVDLERLAVDGVLIIFDD